MKNRKTGDFWEVIVQMNSYPVWGEVHIGGDCQQKHPGLCEPHVGNTPLCVTGSQCSPHIGQHGEQGRDQESMFPRMLASYHAKWHWCGDSGGCHCYFSTQAAAEDLKNEAVLQPWTLALSGWGAVNFTPIIPTLCLNKA